MDAAASPETRLRRHAALIVVALAHVYVFPYFAGLHSPNENTRVYMTRALVENHRLDVGAIEAKWGRVADKAKFDNKVYSGKAPGTSLAGVPAMAVAWGLSAAFGAGFPGLLGTVFALRLGGVILSMLVFHFFFARWLEGRVRSPAKRDLLVLGVGLGSMLYPYGLLFVGHAQGAAAAFAAFMLIGAEPDPAETSPRFPRRLVWAGVWAGLAVVFEYQNLLGAFVLGGWALARHRARFVAFMAGAAGPALLLAVYHALAFGSPFEMPYAHLESTLYQKWHHGQGFLGLGQPDGRAIALSLFSLSYGLFVFSPFLALGVLGALLGLARGPRRGESAVILLVSVVMVVFLSGMANWRGGWCVGPRYITVLAPFLAAGVVELFRQVETRPRGDAAVFALAGGLVFAAVFLTGLSGAMFPHYPEAFDNPVFDLTLPLLREGLAPYNLGGVLGLPGAWGLVPLGLAVAFALGLALAGDPRSGVRRRAAQLGVALLIAGVCLGYASRKGKRFDVDEVNSGRLVRGLWEPKPPVP